MTGKIFDRWRDKPARTMLERFSELCTVGVRILQVAYYLLRILG